MSLWVLDTDMLSLLQLQHPGVIVQALSRLPDAVAISITTVQEVFIGRYDKVKRAKKSRDIIAAYARMEDSMNLLRKLPILSYDVAADAHFAELRRNYRRIGRNDLQIAAVALSHHATLVTRNLIDFGQIDGLPIEDWSK